MICNFTLAIICLLFRCILLCLLHCTYKTYNNIIMQYTHEVILYTDGRNQPQLESTQIVHAITMLVWSSTLHAVAAVVAPCTLRQ